MLAAFQHLKEWFPEVKPDVWTAGYNVLGAELGVHRDLLARDTSISILNQYIAELHLSEANLDKEPDLETLGKPKEKIYLTFENPSIGPPNLKDFSAVEPQWLCQFRIHHARNKGLSQDEITKQMREEARRARDQSGAPKNRDDYTQTFGGKGSSVPPAVLILHLVQVLGHLGKGTMNNGILGHPMYLMERMMFHDLHRKLRQSANPCRSRNSLRSQKNGLSRFLLKV